MNRQPVPYDAERLRVLQRCLSPERFATYLRAAGGDAAAAMALYDWQILVASSLGADLQRLEVVLRNALHDQLTAHFGLYWFDRPALLDERRRGDVTVARKRLRGSHSPGRIVAELNFGFWRLLLAARYEHRLWTPALRHAFPHLKPQRRASVERPVTELHGLRNRLAHCEPVLGRDLAADAVRIQTVAGYIDPCVGEWIRDTSSVAAVLACRPPRPRPGSG